MKNSLPSGRISQAFINITIATLIIFIADFLVSKKVFFFQEPAYVVGEIAPKTVVAPFDFLLYEDSDILEKKQNRAEKKILPHYNLSLGKGFNVQKKINRFFDIVDQHLLSDQSQKELHDQLSEIELQLTPPEIDLLQEETTREKLYNDLTSISETFMNQGILEKIPSSVKIIICYDEVQEQKLSKDLFTKQKVIAEVHSQQKGEESRENYTKLLKKTLGSFLETNLSYDSNTTQKAKKIARSSVPNIIGEVLENELIVQEHQKIDQRIYRKLQALKRETNILETRSEKDKKNFSSVAKFLYIFFVLSFLILLSYIFKIELFFKFSLFRFILILTLFSAIFMIVIQNLESLSLYLLPLGLPIILLAFLIDRKSAMIFGVVNFFLLIGLSGWNFSSSFIILFSNLAAILALKFPRSRRGFYQATFYIFITFIFLNFLFSAINGWGIALIFNHLKWGFFNSIICLLGSMVLLAPIEQRLPVVTNIHLLEVGDFSNKLLKTLSEVASGTYHHSIIVGNLAEAGAKAINANPILARVGSYYHDIGKTKQPEYFIENTGNKENLHNELNSTESAICIKKHVEDGVKLAKEYHLPQALTDFIKQHHGTSKISYFYDQALKNDEKLDEINFQYEGPKPQTKEIAIVMIADIVESTTKSLDSPTHKMIKDAVKKSVKKLIETDQLSECGISLQELKTLEKSFEPILVGIYKKRISYPK